ncbi:unnamed protein product [Rhizophagus irregularis]|nr:unnamed protein product [Rhizophagus irregularis]
MISPLAFVQYIMYSTSYIGNIKNTIVMLANFNWKRYFIEHIFILWRIFDAGPCISRYMFVQMIYGIWTNSLGLISDAIHMFFDCLALAVGLFAAIMSKWPENNKFTYGYGRIETLSGFANGIFLVLISIFIMFEAIGRLIDPPEMNTDRLLLDDSKLHGQQQQQQQQQHHHHHHHHHHDVDNANMEGIYLHVLADTLGSIGVIISTLLINQFGWTGFDPLASIFIAVLIFMSVVPLIKHSAAVLMLSINDNLEYHITEGLHEVLHVDGIASYTMPRFWPNDGERLIGSIHIQINDQVKEQFIISEVTRILKSHITGLEELTIQVEKKRGFNRCLCNLKNNNINDSIVISNNKRKSY